MKNLDEITPEEINVAAEKQAKDLKENKVKTNQIRNVYAAITKIRNDFEVSKKYETIAMEFVLLKPKIAYAAGRDKGVRASFHPFLKEAIEGVQNSEDKEKALRNFIYLVESVVAYHKFYDPKN